MLHPTTDFSYVYYPSLEERLTFTLFFTTPAVHSRIPFFSGAENSRRWGLPFLTRIPIRRCAGACGVDYHHWVEREITLLCVFLDFGDEGGMQEACTCAGVHVGAWWRVDRACACIGAGR